MQRSDYGECIKRPRCGNVSSPKHFHANVMKVSPYPKNSCSPDYFAFFHGTSRLYIRLLNIGLVFFGTSYNTELYTEMTSMASA